MDPIANMLSQIKNAVSISKKETRISYSKLNLAILEILKNRGFILGYEENKNKDKKYPSGIKVLLKYKENNETFFTDIKRVSRPGRRVYIKNKDLNKTRRGKIDIVLSTPQGVMSISDAQKKGLGGEVICEVK